LPTTPTIDILNPIIEYLCGDGRYNNQNASLLTRCLALLVFVDSYSVGINRIREGLVAAKLSPYELRDLIHALGASCCEAALSLLEEIVDSLADDDGLKQIAAVWIDILLSFIEPASEDRFKFDFESYYGDVLVSHIAELTRVNNKTMRRTLAFYDAEISPTKRTLLSKLVSRLGTSEAVVAGLKLIDDGASQPVPFDLSQAIERSVLNSVHTTKP